MRNIVILAPHPDDEILGCVGVIKSSAPTGNLWVVIATNGDIAGRDLAATRIEESFAALSRLNVSSGQIIVMGYGDTGMEPEDSFLYRLYHSDGDTVLPSFVSTSTYHPLHGGQEWFYQMQKCHGNYTRNNFLYNLETLFLHCAPDEIYVSSQYDMHGDHYALYQFVLEAINRQKISPLVRQYIIHGGDDTQWPERNTDCFTRPLVCGAPIWKGRTIFKNIDMEEKLGLIEIFKSQITSEYIPSGYLQSFAKKEEVFV